MRRAEEFEEFEQLRPLLFSIGYRILGSVGEAEDAVQETWLRYQASPAQPTSAKAFLSAVVTRISIYVLRSARSRREEYARPWFPGPLLDGKKPIKHRPPPLRGAADCSAKAWWRRWRTPGHRGRPDTPRPPASSP